MFTPITLVLGVLVLHRPTCKVYAVGIIEYLFLLCMCVDAFIDKNQFLYAIKACQFILLVHGLGYKTDGLHGPRTIDSNG